MKPNENRIKSAWNHHRLYGKLSMLVMEQIKDQPQHSKWDQDNRNLLGDRQPLHMPILKSFFIMNTMQVGVLVVIASTGFWAGLGGQCPTTSRSKIWCTSKVKFGMSLHQKIQKEMNQWVNQILNQAYQSSYGKEKSVCFPPQNEGDSNNQTLQETDDLTR